MKRVLLGAFVLALLLPGRAEAGRYAIGVEPGASLNAVAAEVARVSCGRVTMELAPMRALLVTAPGVRGVARIAGVSYVERVTSRRSLSFAPKDPLAPRQWYLGYTKAFEAWPEPPSLAAVRVAIVDSGIDADHPEFAGRIAGAQTFVGGSARVDEHGHGTFVAGVIAANLNDQGIAGIAFPAQL